MKKIFLTAAFCVAFLWSLVACSAVFAQLYDEKGNPLPEVPEESQYDAILQKMLSGEKTSGEPESADFASHDAASFDEAGDIGEIEGDGEAEANALDELMKKLIRGNATGDPAETDVPDIPLFDGTPWGLEGTWVVAQEESGNLSPGKVFRVRMAVLRKSDGLLDRAVALEITPSGEEPFLIRLADDVRGFEASFELQNFMAADSSEIVFSIKSGARETVRCMVIRAANREGEILYDSDAIKVPTILGQFFDNYRAEIIVKETDSHSLIDLFPRKRFYDARLVYNDISGTLRNPIRVWISGSAQPQVIDADNDGVHELRSILELSGVGRADRIAWVDATLKYRDGKWNLIDCWVAPAEDLSLIPIPKRIN